MDENILDLDMAFADTDTQLYYIWKSLCQMNQKISKLEAAVDQLTSAISNFKVTGITITESEHISYTHTKK